MLSNLGRQTILTEVLFLLSPSRQIPGYRLPLIGHGLFLPHPLGYANASQYYVICTMHVLSEVINEL